VKILFDANTPAPLAHFLRGHAVVRADEMHWQGMENAALLDAAEQAGFDLLLTCDQNVRYQQNFTGRKLAMVVLSSNHWPTIETDRRQDSCCRCRQRKPPPYKAVN
jgi:hypothetical protein